jgi:hypothetical protein
MNLSEQLQNNELRCNSAVVGQVLGLMPGGQPLAIGEQHTIGAVPEKCFTTGWVFTAARLSSDVVVSVGFTDNPTFWLDNVTVSNGDVLTNDKLSAMQDYFPDGADIVLTVHSGTLNEDSLLRFVLLETELETKLGKYTA